MTATPSFQSESRTSNQTPRSSTTSVPNTGLTPLPPLEQHILKLAETVSVLLNEPIPPPTQGVPQKSAPPSPAPLSKRVTRLPSQRVLLIGAIIIIAAAVSVGYY